MSLTVLPSSGPFSGSSLLTWAITTLLMGMFPSQLSVMPVTKSEICIVSYRWLGGHSSMCIGLSVIVGASVSLTVTVNPQLGPAAVEQLTLVVPTGKKDPEGGEQVTNPHPAVVVGAKLTFAPHWPGALLTTIFDGQLIVQASATVTVKLHEAVLLLVSVAVQLTVVVPTGKFDPEAGLHAKVAPGQLSLTAGFG